MNINDAYINALLSDASYVDGLSPEFTPDDLSLALTSRMTDDLAEFIANNFTVAVQESKDGLLESSFDATVWIGKEGTVYAGQVYVSMRGTQEAIDFDADYQLTSSGLAHKQLVDMVNWWLRETTPINQMAVQISYTATRDFVAAPSIQGTGNLVGIDAIKSVNGHSLGGYLATAFTRIFGEQWPVGEVNTFNSAGFSRDDASNIEDGFNQIAGIIGAEIGLASFAESTQNYYFAENGINVTTNKWDPVGFMQYGDRVALFQEDLVSGDQGVSN